MNDGIRLYLRAPCDRLWFWADGGRCVAWQDGSTVAFREELAAVFEQVAARGLPLFEAVVILFAASRGSFPRAGDIMELQVPGKEPRHALQVAVDEAVSKRVEHAIALLKKLGNFRKPLIGPVEAKAVLVEMLIEAGRPELETQAECEAVLAALRDETLTDELLNPRTDDTWVNDHLQAIHLVADAIEEFSEEQMASRLSTSLESAPAEAELPGLPFERVRGLLAELEDQPETSGLVSLVRDIMAALYLPKRLSESDEMPVGGVADLSNRGTLDKLLLSELAHDDLTLAVRVALNEALYLRREPPAAPPPGSLRILIDCGIRMWGVPRVFSIASALALVAMDRHRDVRSYYSEGTDLLACDLLSKEGLFALLEKLTPDLYPSESALRAFFREAIEDESAERVLVVSDNTWTDEGFRRLLSAWNTVSVLLVTVSREGVFEVRCVPGDSRPICCASLDLEKVAPGTERRPLTDAEKFQDWPLIYQVAPFPFYLPVRGGIPYGIELPAELGYAAVTETQQLIRWFPRHRGVTVLARKVRGGKILLLRYVESLQRLFYIGKGGDTSSTEIVQTDLEGLVVERKVLPTGNKAVVAELEGDFLLVATGLQAWILNAEDLELLGTLPLPEWSQWVRGFVFRTGQSFQVIRWDGQRFWCETDAFSGHENTPPPTILRQLPAPSHRSTRNKLAGISFRSGILHLLTPKGAVHVLSLRSLKCIGFEQRENSSMETGEWIPFVPWGEASPGGRTLQIARLGVEAAAILDEDGFLTLRPPDRDLPEITMALSEGLLAAWSSDGWIVGPPSLLREVKKVKKRAWTEMIPKIEAVVNSIARCARSEAR